MLLNKKLPISFILNKIKLDILYVVAIALTVYAFTRLYGEHFPEMPLTIPAFMGTAISILLSFKLGQSYDRWWEARKIWGAIVNDSRTFVIQLKSFVGPDHRIVKKLAYRQMAWCYCLSYSLRNKETNGEVKKMLNEEDFDYIKNHDNKPLAMLNLHSRDIAQLKKEEELDVFLQIQLDETLVRLCASMGKAERIKNTVFPVTYRLYLHFIIYIFLVTLSVALAGITIFFKMPLLLLISVAFFLLEKTATYMQDPFNDKPTDTPMSAISRTIEINIRQLLEEKDIPEKFGADSFFLM
jgi:putative membrane protein